LSLSDIINIIGSAKYVYLQKLVSKNIKVFLYFADTRLL